MPNKKKNAKKPAVKVNDLQNKKDAKGGATSNTTPAGFDLVKIKSV